MRRFSLYRRRGIYYAQFHNPETGRRSLARSTGTRDRDEATMVVYDWLRDGLPTPGSAPQRTRRALAQVLSIDTIVQQLRTLPLEPQDVDRVLATLKERRLILEASLPQNDCPTLLSFLTEFWTFDTSPYVREKVAHGQRIGRRHCSDALSHVNRHWSGALGQKRLPEITRQDLKAFSLELKETKNLAAATINLITVTGTTALKWAFNNGLISTDPTEGLMRFSGASAKRGVLTPDEATRLFSVPWDDERARIANLVSMTTGLRSGEILGLQERNIGADRISVEHSWSPHDGLKAPKNGEPRIVHLLPAVRNELAALMANNPHPDHAFVFYGTLPDKPMDKNFLNFGLQRALMNIGIGEEERVARGICFHSWRHFFATEMANRVGERAMKLTGHNTESVFQVYANHAGEREFQELSAAAAGAFGGLIASGE